MDNLMQEPLPTVQHIATPEDIASVKEMAAARAVAEGRPVQPIFSKKFPGDKVQFLYTWLTSDKYEHMTDNKMYQDQLEKNPEAAHRYFQIQVMQECVVWPTTFNPSLKEDLQPYPAGVVGGLFDAIMYSSGFTQDAAPDHILVQPEEPSEPTKEEIEALMLEHPLAKQFRVTFEKPFFVRDFDFDAGEYKLVPTRYYLYTQIDRDNYRKAKEESDDDKAMNIVLGACVLWPKDIDWGKEPANYGEWLFKSIMMESGFGLDPSSGVEEV